MRGIVLLFLSFFAFASAEAQVNFSSPRPGNSVVTILSDGVSEPNGLVTQLLSDLSLAFDKDASLRVLPVMGFGGEPNVRDLLQLRGADFAILNNDIFTFLDLQQNGAEARRRIRSVVPLFHQTVFLFAKAPIRSVEALKGKKVGVLASSPSRLVTAKAVFSALKIDAEIVALSDKDLAARLTKDLDAVLLYQKDAQDLKSLGISPAGFAILNLPVSGALGKTYLGKKIEQSRLGAFGAGQDLQTIQVTTLLAAYDWTDKQGRYFDVIKFTQRFFAMLPELRAGRPNSPWSTTDMRVDLPGWQRYGPVEPLIASLPALAPREEKGAIFSVPAAREAQGSSDALRLSIGVRPPLADQRQSDGGVVAKLFMDSLAQAGIQPAVRWDQGFREQIDSLLSDKTSDVALFFETRDCDRPRDFSAASATLCDSAVLSEPVMQIIVGLFARKDTQGLNVAGDPGQEHTLCLPEAQALPAPGPNSPPWLKDGKIKLVRPKTVLDCVAAVDSREADGMIANEPEVRFVMEKLKLGGTFQMADKPVGVIGLHAALAKDNPRAPDILLKINRALAAFRASDRYAAIMATHMAELTKPAKSP